MILTIRTMPKVAMVDLFAARPDLLEKFFVISICDPGESRPFSFEHPHLLNLSFCDVGPEELPHELRERYPSLSTQDAVAVRAFVTESQRHATARHLLIHCAAGVSRSGAIAQFAMELLNLDEEQFKRDNAFISPHPELLQMLRETVAADIAPDDVAKDNH